jgi:hypothetical protein
MAPDPSVASQLGQDGFLAVPTAWVNENMLGLYHSLAEQLVTAWNLTGTGSTALDGASGPYQEAAALDAQISGAYGQDQTQSETLNLTSSAAGSLNGILESMNGLDNTVQGAITGASGVVAGLQTDVGNAIATFNSNVLYGIDPTDFSTDGYTATTYNTASGVMSAMSYTTSQIESNVSGAYQTNATLASLISGAAQQMNSYTAQIKSIFAAASGASGTAGSSGATGTAGASGSTGSDTTPDDEDAGVSGASNSDLAQEIADAISGAYQQGADTATGSSTAATGDDGDDEDDEGNTGDDEGDDGDDEGDDTGDDGADDAADEDGDDEADEMSEMMQDMMMQQEMQQEEADEERQSQQQQYNGQGDQQLQQENQDLQQKNQDLQDKVDQLEQGACGAGQPAEGASGPAPTTAPSGATAPAGTPIRPTNSNGTVTYTFPDGRTQEVSPTVATMLDAAFGNSSTTDAQAAYAKTSVRWSSGRDPGSRVDPSALMTGDIAKWDNRMAIVVAWPNGAGTGGASDGSGGAPSDGSGGAAGSGSGELDIIANGQMMPFSAQMHDGQGDFGSFDGFFHPAGIEPSTTGGGFGMAAGPDQSQSSDGSDGSASDPSQSGTDPSGGMSGMDPSQMPPTS